MLDATTAERLVRLRVLLTQAQTRAGDSTQVSVHGTVIALDAACELALGLCLHELGVSPKRSFPEKVAQVRDELAAEWTHPGLQGVDELHRTRNNTQHSGVLPDAQHLPIWASEAERFIRSLVAVIFGVELLDVSAADAIADADLRELLRQGERSLAAGDATDAMNRAWRALAIARERWSFQHGRLFEGSRPNSSRSGVIRRGDETRRSGGSIDEYLEIALFAGNPGAFFALKAHADSYAVADIDPAMARRGLVFALEWILRWEAFSAAYPIPETPAWRLRQHAPSTGYDHPKPVIIDIRPLEERFPGSDASVRLQLADLPSHGEIEWSSEFSNAMQSVRKSRPRLSFAQLKRDGQLDIHLSEGADADEIRDIAVALIDDTQARYEARIAEAEALDARATALAQPFLPLLDQSGIVQVRDVQAEIERAGSRPSRGDRVEVAFSLPEDIPWRAFAAALDEEPAIDIAVFGDRLSFPAAGAQPRTVGEALERAATRARETLANASAAAHARTRGLEQLVEEARGKLVWSPARRSDATDGPSK